MKENNKLEMKDKTKTCTSNKNPFILLKLALATWLSVKGKRFPFVIYFSPFTSGGPNPAYPSLAALGETWFNGLRNATMTQVTCNKYQAVEESHGPQRNVPSMIETIAL